MDVILGYFNENGTIHINNISNIHNIFKNNGSNNPIIITKNNLQQIALLIKFLNHFNTLSIELMLMLKFEITDFIFDTLFAENYTILYYFDDDICIKLNNQITLRLLINLDYLKKLLFGSCNYNLKIYNDGKPLNLDLSEFNGQISIMFLKNASSFT